MISVILTKYKRQNLFKEQLDSVKNQSLKPCEVLICDNTINNKGVWERFNTAKQAKGDFVCIMDDDTIPGVDWLQNCYNSFQVKEGVYGTCGYLFNSNKQYENNYERIGWCNPIGKITQVDYVVHNWFFKKEWLKFFWKVDNVPHNYGEDMNLSFQLQKEGINTYVPPHPLDIQSLWGSLKGIEYGDDENSLWVSNPNNFKNKMYGYFDKQINEGWKLLNKETLI
jgi:glycosyltransferase involved in cell wall biosynthesis